MRPDIENAFEDLSTRDDIGILLINQVVKKKKKFNSSLLSYDLSVKIKTIIINNNKKKVADQIRYLITAFDLPRPVVLEIPSKDHPYDEKKDAIMVRVRMLLGRKSDD